MNYLDVYNDLQRNEITLEQACKVLSIEIKAYENKAKHWGHRFPLMLSVLDKIKSGAISTAEASSILGIQLRQVNNIMVEMGVERPLKTYKVKREMSQIKWELHKKFAIDFIADSTSIETAAADAGVSTRQMRREVSKLLDKHFGMVYKDLAEISNVKRRRLATEIEAAENLEFRHQQVLKSIADGEISLKDEAINRVIARHAKFNRRRPGV